MTTSIKEKKAVILLSGGLDSTTTLALALRDNDEAICVQADYGQKHIRERESAALIVREYQSRGKRVKLIPIELPRIFGGAGSTLIDPYIQQPHMTYKEIAESEGPSPTVVPFRNANLLSAATTIAIVENAQQVYAGMHAEDARNFAYPDCTPEFLGAMANAIYVGTYQKVRLIFPLIWMMKKDIARLAYDLDVPIELTYSCYEGGNKHCGLCPTCIERKEAFKAIDRPDKVEYAQ